MHIGKKDELVRHAQLVMSQPVDLEARLVTRAVAVTAAKAEERQCTIDLELFDEENPQVRRVRKL